MIKLSLCWNQVVRWLRRDISKIIILRIVWEIIFQNEQKIFMSGPRVNYVGAPRYQVGALTYYARSSTFYVAAQTPPLGVWSGCRDLNMSEPRIIMSGPLPVTPGPEISMSCPQLIMSGPLLVMCGPRDNYVGPLLIMSGPLTYYFEASR